MWTQERGAELSYKGTVPEGPSRIRVAGGADCTYIPFVLVNRDTITLWFEAAVIWGGVNVYNAQVPIKFKEIPGFVTPEPNPGEGLSVFDIDAFVHASDHQLKVTILAWRGDRDTSRDVYVLRTGFYDRG